MKKFKEILAQNLLLDSHAHIGLNNGPTIDLQVMNAKKSGVAFVFNMATKLDDWPDVIKLAEDYPEIILPCLGIHPEEADTAPTNIETELLEYKDKILMIGEIGLDYYWREDNKDRQRQIFEDQLMIAEKFNLPVSVHVRNAYDDALNILNQVALPAEVVLHSFTGSYEDLVKARDKGYYLGVNGIITYTKAEDLRQILKKYIGTISEPTIKDFYDKGILFETDSPLLRPSNAVTNGRENEPANVLKVYEALCRLARKSH